MQKMYAWFANLTNDHLPITGDLKVIFWLAVVCALLLGGLILYGIIAGTHDLIDQMTGDEFDQDGTIVKKTFAPSTYQRSDRYILFVQEAYQTGEKSCTHDVYVDKDQYFRYEEGQKVRFKKKVGGISQKVLNVEIV